MGTTNFDIVDAAGGVKVGGTQVIDENGDIVGDIKDTLADGSMYIGDATNTTSEVTMSGDVTISNTGVTSLGLSTVAEGNTAGISPADNIAEDRILLVKRFSWDFADADANDDLLINVGDVSNIEIVDVWCDMATAEGGALTLTLYDTAAKGGSAISSDLDCNVTSIERTTSLAANTLGPLASLYGNFSANPAVAVGVLYISYVKTSI